MAVFRIRVCEVTNHAAYLLTVRFALFHSILRAAHLAGCNHFHRARNFLRVFHTANFLFYFFTAGHDLYLYTHPLKSLGFFKFSDGAFQCLRNFITIFASFINIFHEITVLRTHIAD